MIVSLDSEVLKGSIDSNSFPFQNSTNQHRFYDWTSSYKYSTNYEHNTININKGALIHKNALGKWWDEKYEPLRKMVDSYNLGEDMALSFVLANEYGDDIIILPYYKYRLSMFCSQLLLS